MTPGFFLQRLDEVPSEIIQQFMPHLPYPLLQKAESLRLALIELEAQLTPTTRSDQPELFCHNKNRDMVLDFIAEHVREWGRHPTYAQICTHMGWKSLASAQFAIKKLVESGHLEKYGRSYRIIRDSRDNSVLIKPSRG